MSVSEKVLLIMADVGMLSKDKKIQSPGSGNYGYLSEEKVTAELHAACVKHKLVVMPIRMEILDNRVDQTNSGKNMFVTRILVTYRLIDPAEGGDSVEVQALGEGSDMGDKTLNKCMTAAFKYAMRQTFMISTGEDPDHAASEESTASTYTRSAQAARSTTATTVTRNGGGGNAGATLRDLFKAMEEADLLEPDPTDERPDRQKPVGNFYGIMDKAGLPRTWSKFTPEQYTQAIAAVKDHVARHENTPALPDIGDPFADE